jgi:tRNA threonylcarbamoyladenosine biosynthesis protein TsaB
VPILGIDTTSSRGSIALARPREILASADLAERGAHARDLLVRIDGLLETHGLKPRDLAGVAVAVGPGSFTGVRVGMATAKGLAYSLNIGLAGLSTLEALARAAQGGIPGAASTLCAAIEAGRGEIYAALFRCAPGGPARLGPDRSWRPADLIEALPPEASVVGDGLEAIRRAARAAGRAALAAVEPPPPLAGAIALWAWSVLTPGAAYRTGDLRPNYVRPADAEAGRRPT